MGRRDRERKPARRKMPFRDPKPIILIVCEGEKTEPQYLKGFQALCRNPRVQIELHGGRGVPQTLVSVAQKKKKEAEQQAKREKDDNLKFDAVWCVFDCDDHHHLPATFQTARQSEIRIAYSSPCFELWLLLHFREQPGMKHRDEVVKMLAEFVPDYEKKVNITLFVAGYAEAVKRAERLVNRPDDQPIWDRNPYTDVHRLTAVIAEEALPNVLK